VLGVTGEYHSERPFYNEQEVEFDQVNCAYHARRKLEETTKRPLVQKFEDTELKMTRSIGIAKNLDKKQ